MGFSCPGRVPYNRGMSSPILATKLYVPPPLSKAVLRPHLLDRLNRGLDGKVTLVSAAAGFGKTTLISAWVAGCGRPTAWVALDKEHIDPARFLTYVVAALQTILPAPQGGTLGQGVLTPLQSPSPPPIDALLTALLNDIALLPDPFVLVLDDYHVVDAQAVDDALVFLIANLPASMHLVISSREDPQLPLARLRARGQLTELRAADLRFSRTETADFLTQVMELPLSAADIAALEARTEGWIAGLQLAGLSLRGHQEAGQADIAQFIASFTGSHRFVLDYLMEEVLQQQPDHVQVFLLRTSILERFCGSLCDAVLRDPGAPGQATLEYLEQANLFIVPLDNQRGWYRYHHLFADLLRQRLHQANDVLIELAASERDLFATDSGPAVLHHRASLWYEEKGLELEAFQHAAAAGDMARAARLVEGGGMPLLFRGAVQPVLSWLESLATTELDAHPSLWVIYASAMLFVGSLTHVEEALHAAEAALARTTRPDGAEDELSAESRDLIGHIAAIRATLGVLHFDGEAIVTQSRRALEYLNPDNLAVRTSTIWTMAVAYELEGDRVAAARAYAEAIEISQSIGHFIITVAATIGLGGIQLAENQLPRAADTFHHVLQLLGEPPVPGACEAHRGLAAVYYAWNDLDATQRHAAQCLALARQLESSDRLVAGELVIAQLLLAQGDVTGAAAQLERSRQAARRHGFARLLPEIDAANVVLLLRQGELAAAAQLAEQSQLPASQARVLLAQGNPAAALALLTPLRQLLAVSGPPADLLRVLLLHALAHQANGALDAALEALDDALTLAAPARNIRVFVDEGAPMAQLLSAAATRGTMPDFVGTLLVALAADGSTASVAAAPRVSAAPSNLLLVELLSQRELEILRLIAAGRKNQEIADELIISLNTVRYHTKNLFGKLGVNKRTQAVARAIDLGLI